MAGFKIGQRLRLKKRYRPKVASVRCQSIGKQRNHTIGEDLKGYQVEKFEWWNKARGIQVLAFKHIHGLYLSTCFELLPPTRRTKL